MLFNIILSYQFTFIFTCLALVCSAQRHSENLAQHSISWELEHTNFLSNNKEAFPSKRLINFEVSGDLKLVNQATDDSLSQDISERISFWNNSYESRQAVIEYSEEVEGLSFIVSDFLIVGEQSKHLKDKYSLTIQGLNEKNEPVAPVLLCNSNAVSINGNVVNFSKITSDEVLVIFPMSVSRVNLTAKNMQSVRSHFSIHDMQTVDFNFSNTENISPSEEGNEIDCDNIDLFIAFDLSGSIQTHELNSFIDKLKEVLEGLNESSRNKIRLNYVEFSQVASLGYRSENGYKESDLQPGGGDYKYLMNLLNKENSTIEKNDLTDWGSIGILIEHDDMLTKPDLLIVLTDGIPNAIDSEKTDAFSALSNSMDKFYSLISNGTKVIVSSSDNTLSSLNKPSEVIFTNFIDASFVTNFQDHLPNCKSDPDIKQLVFDIFPNPANDYFEVILRNDLTSEEYFQANYSIKIIDGRGREIKKEILGNNTNYRFDSSDLPSGVYSVSLFRQDELVESNFLVITKD